MLSPRPSLNRSGAYSETVSLFQTLATLNGNFLMVLTFRAQTNLTDWSPETSTLFKHLLFTVAELDCL